MLLRRYLHPTLDVRKEKQRRNDNDDFSSDQPAGSRLHARRSSSGLIFAPKHSHLLEVFFFLVVHRHALSDLDSCQFVNRTWVGGRCWADKAHFALRGR